MGSSLQTQKKYLQNALAYLQLLSAHHPDQEGEGRKIRRFLHEVEAMFIGHQATTYSRSASHELGPLRRSQEPTITHPYEVCVDEINFWMTLIDEAQTEEEEEALFYNLKLGTLRALFHDTLEDYYIPPEELGQKLIEMLNQDLRISPPMREADFKINKLPSNLNFADSNRRIIISELLALKAPENKDDRIEELFRQIHGLPSESRVRTYLTKLRDRKNNTSSPKYKKAGREIEKLSETIEIVELGLALYMGAISNNFKNPGEKQLLPEINKLVQMCQGRIVVLKRDPKDAESSALLDFVEHRMNGLATTLQEWSTKSIRTS